MEYTNLINARYIELARRSVIYPKFKVEVIDASETVVIKEIVQDIDASTGGSISISYQQGVRMSCSLTFINKDSEYAPSALSGMFWIGTKFRLFIGLYDDVSDDTYWFSEGVYYVNNPVVTKDFTSQLVTIEGIDKFGIFGSELGYNQLLGTYRIEAGQKIYDVINTILMLEVGNGNVIDPIPPLFDPLYKDEVLPYDINKAQGSYLGDILIELANILGANIYYDKTGRLNIESGTLDISYSQDAAIWHFSEGDTEYMTSSLSYDFPNVINVVKVIGNNVNGAVYSYIAENNNPVSPTRIEYIGRKEMAPIETPLATSEQRARDYAEFKLNSLSIVQSTFDFQCSLLPHLDVDLVCTITDEYYGYNRQRFIIQSITMPLNITSTMQISASNIASLPYYDLMVGGS